MSREWFYTKDGYEKTGPLSAAELQALAQSGQLSPADHVWKQGMDGWKRANTINGLFNNIDTAPQIATDQAWANAESGSALVGQWMSGIKPATISRVSLGATIALSLLAAIVAMTRIGGDYFAPCVAGLGILASFIVIALGLSARVRFVYLGSAGLAVFVSFAALLFSIGANIFADKVDQANSLILRAGPIADDKKKAEELYAKANQKLEEVTSEPKRLLQLVDEKNERLNDYSNKLADEAKGLKQKDNELRSWQQKLTTDQRSFQTYKTTTMTELDKRKTELDKERDDFKNEKSRFQKYKGDEIAKLDTEKETLKSAQVKFDAFVSEANKKLDEKRNDAHSKLMAANKANESALRLRNGAALLNTKTEHANKEAKEYYKKIMDEFVPVKKELQSKLQSTRFQAIKLVSRLVPFPDSAKPELRPLGNDLCELLCQNWLWVSDTDAIGKKVDGQIRRLARQSLRKLRPEKTGNRLGGTTWRIAHEQPYHNFALFQFGSNGRTVDLWDSVGATHTGLAIFDKEKKNLKLTVTGRVRTSGRNETRIYHAEFFGPIMVGTFSVRDSGKTYHWYATIRNR